MTSFKSFFMLQVIIVALLAGSFKTASADIVTNVLDAQSVVNSFNSLNGGKGAYFAEQTHFEGSGYMLKSVTGKQFADVSAYKGRLNGSDFFSTFCVEPTIKAYTPATAKLNYSGGTSKTTLGNALTVGAAYLYSMFATDQYKFNSTDITSIALGGAIRYLIGDPGTGEANMSWSSNYFLNELAKINDLSYWQSIYNPDSYYSEIGNYSVFVMNVTSAESSTMGKDSQDFLYVANAAHPYLPPPPPTTATPEPASMLIFGLGIAGFAVARRIRKK